MNDVGVWAAFAAGVLAGVVGAVPFAHPNTVLAFAAPWLDGLALAVFAAALSGANVVFSLAPALVFLFPSPSYGAALDAFRAAPHATLRVALPSLFAAFAAGLALLPLAFAVVPFVAPFARAATLPLLSLVVLAALAADERPAAAAAAFALSGAVGFVSLAAPLPSDDRLFPLLAGLFAVPALFANEPAETASGAAPPAFSLPVALAAAVLGALANVLPALSPAFLAALLFLVLDARFFPCAYFAALASKTLYDAAFVFITGATRSGTAVAIHAGAAHAPPAAPVLVLAALAAAFFLALFAASRLAPMLSRASLAVLRFRTPAALSLALASLALGGPVGLAAFAAAAAAGAFAQCVGAPRRWLMGALITPALLHAAGWSGALASLVFAF